MPGRRERRTRASSTGDEGSRRAEAAADSAHIASASASHWPLRQRPPQRLTAEETGIAHVPNNDPFPGIGDLVDGQPPVRAQLGIEHRAGGRNDVPRSVYHEVTEIHEPGRTLSLMVCGRGERGAWGYLDTTGLHTPTAPDPDFKAKLRQLNPHLVVGRLYRGRP
uniref:hypothetical protein n=1 Tax=Amycolatopsis sp. CA-096443 TaxID=3239919 RepID=UPI003F4977B7